ncbi:MAG TPA: hypothetical protein VFN67_18975 [Polyangiales bacterium]|nr:hypothetical protein [Polyangiales bacterium]
MSASAPELPRSRSLDLPLAHDAMRVRLRELGLNERTLDDSEVERSHRLPTGGSIVQVSQRAHGVPVFRARASLTMDADQRVVAASQGLSSALTQREPTAFVLTPEQALAEFYSTRAGSPLSAADVALAIRPEQYKLYTRPPAPRVLAANAKRVYFPMDGVDPTFIEQRDALTGSVQAMARDDASRQADVDAFKQGFAKRGLGAGGRPAAEQLHHAERSGRELRSASAEHARCAQDAVSKDADASMRLPSASNARLG